MRNFEIKDFNLGLDTANPPDKVKQGASTAMKNWLAHDGKLKLSGGSQQVGATTFSGASTGLYSTSKSDGTIVTWNKIGAKLYAIDGSGDWSEVGTDMFGSAAASDVATFAEWKGISGQWVWVSSTNSGLFKLSVVNPTSYVSYPSVGFKGDISIIQNRLWVSNYLTTGGVKDTSGKQLSYQPPATVSSFTAVSGESIGTGDGSDKTFTATLAFKSVATRTCLGVSVETPILDISSVAISGISKAAQAVVTTTNSIAGIVTTGIRVFISGVAGMTQINSIGATATYISDHSFSVNIDSTAFSNYVSDGSLWKCNLPMTDDGSGHLNAVDGSTGTVDYATGSVSVAYQNAPPLNAPLPVAYLYEDSSADGLAKFSPLSSAAGDGKAHYLPMPGIGESRGVFAYGNKAYALHTQGVYEVSFDAYGDPASSLIFRKTTGPSSKMGAVATADGIFYVDDATGTDTKIRVIETVNQSGNVFVDNPSVSDSLDLNDYDFSAAAMAVRGDFTVIACSSTGDGINDTVLVRSKKHRSFSLVSYPAKTVSPYGSKLIYGDLALGAVYTMMDGTQFGGENADNFYDTGTHDCNYAGLKRIRHLWAEGRMASSQTLVFYAKTDDLGWSEIGRVSGDDQQTVDESSGAIGDDAIGESAVGVYDTQPSWPFEVSFPWFVKHQNATVRVVAVGIGDAQVDSLTLHDIRLCGSRLPQRFRK
jgi:hypothetical protein